MADQAFEFLQAHETAAIHGITQACSLLPAANPALDLLRQAVTASRQLNDSRLLELLKDVSRIWLPHLTVLNAAHRPFEIFWFNPSEPRHSALLAYFIDPREAHGCGVSLLRHFFRSLGLYLAPDSPFVADERCLVETEAGVVGHSGSSRPIDILITRRCGDGHNFAIIIENKINGAVDQHEQLSDYIEGVRRRGFKDEEIHVVYLPLRYRRPPSHGRPLPKLQVATFEKEIVTWLEACLADRTIDDKEMKDNLRHYLRLLQYRLDRERKEHVGKQMVDLLQKALSQGTLPNWEQVISLKQKAEELVGSYRVFWRAQLLNEICSRLGSTATRLAWSGLTDESILDAFDQPMNSWLTVGLETSQNILSAVTISTGLEAEIGYRRRLPQRDESLFRFVHERHTPILEGAVTNAESWWYAVQREQLSPERTVESTAVRLAGRIQTLHQRMSPVVKSFTE